MSELQNAIAAKQAELDALRAQAREEQAAAELAAQRERFAAIAAEVQGDTDAVIAFVSKVAEHSGYGVSYLLDVMTGQSRVSTFGSGHWA
jgi:predicted phage gp36 major capsid-like protein